MENNNNSRYRISIESRMTRVETKLEEILVNHLPHLEAKVDKITWLIITTLVTVVIDLIVRFAE